MKLKTSYMYLQFFSGILFLITAGSFNSTENSNLAPVFASIGFALISLAFVFYGKSKKSLRKCDKN